MLRVFALNYINIGALMTDMSAHFSLRSSEGNSPEENAQLDQSFRSDLKSILNECKKLNLSTSVQLIESRLENIPQTEGELTMLADVIFAELRGKLFLFVPPHRASFYEAKIVNDVTATAFPRATQELRAAGNCFACGLHTACVFHCMRGLEGGLASIASEVEVNASFENWKTIIDQIGKKIASLRETLPKGSEKQERIQFLSEAAKEFWHFKDGWRNHVAHAHATYTEPQAQAVMGHVVSFFEVLSTKLNERL